jgi:peptide deformylase
MIREILLLGNPRLHLRAEPLEKPELGAALEAGKDLLDTLMDFRARHGWGRGIAAPQIGVLKRMVYLNVDKPWLLINPVMQTPSPELLEIWDDCMSFPDLLVRVKRHLSFTLVYRDEQWTEQTMRIDGPLSELLQHELDHLDGVLAVARAIDGTSFALQSQRHLLREAAGPARNKPPAEYLGLPPAPEPPPNPARGHLCH